MKLNKTMVDMLYEIRHQQPLHIKARLKLSAPNLGWLLTQIYDHTDSKYVQKLIIVFMREAGGNWLRQLLNKEQRYQVDTGSAKSTTNMNNVIVMATAKQRLSCRRTMSL